MTTIDDWDIVKGKWTHFVITRKSRRVRLYVNGKCQCFWHRFWDFINPKEIYARFVEEKRI